MVYMHQYMYFMSTWLLMSASPHLHTYMERWVPLCGTVCVIQSSTSGCPHPGQNVYIHQYMYTCSLSDSPYLNFRLQLAYLHGKMGVLCVALCVTVPVTSTCGPTSWIECVHTSVHGFILILLPISVWYPVDSYMVICVPLCSTVCVPITVFMGIHLG